MPYAQPYVKLNIEGHFGSSTSNKVEYWNAGLHLTKNGGMTAIPADLLSFLTSISTDVTTFHVNTANMAGSNCYVDSLSAALIGTDGHYVGGALQSTTRYTYTTPPVGVATPGCPWATAMVWSLRSLLQRGPASHGRVYYPAAGMNITGSTGVIVAASLANYATAVQVLINAINAKATSSFGVSCNIGNVSPKGSGFQSPVTSVLFGQKPDHMESRERNLSEAYVTKTLTVSAALEAQRNKEFKDFLEELEDENEAAGTA